MGWMDGWRKKQNKDMLKYAICEKKKMKAAAFEKSMTREGEEDVMWRKTTIVQASKKEKSIEIKKKKTRGRFI